MLSDDELLWNSVVRGFKSFGMVLTLGSRIEVCPE